MLIYSSVTSQNIGIGTTDPQAKLHVNGNFKLQNGVAVNNFSADSTFNGATHNNIPTEKAIKDYLSKGYFAGPFDETPFLRSCSQILLDNPKSIYVNDNRAYVVSENNDMLLIYDVSIPEAIHLIGSTSVNLDGPVGIAVQEPYAYVICSGNNRICVFNISDATNIVARGFTGVLDPRSVSAAGDFVYVVDFLSLIRINVIDPDNIFFAGQTITNLSGPTSVFFHEQIVYVTSAGNNRLCTFGAGLAPLNFTTENLATPRSVFVRESNVYVVSESGLAVFDLALAPKDLTNAYMSFPRSLFVTNKYAYVMSDNGLSWYDITNADSVISKGIVNGPLSNGAVYVRDQYVYTLSSAENKMCILKPDENKSLIIGTEGISISSPIWKNNASMTKAYTLFQNLGIGISDPQSPLAFPPTTGKKITLYQATTGEAGISIGGQPRYVRIYPDNIMSGISFGYYLQDMYFERFRINATGNVVEATGGAYCTGTTWNNASDSTLKENIKLVNGEDILNKISRLPVSTWNYKADPSSVVHIGPMAQDFKAIFNTGNNDKAISTIDPSGVALAGIQALLNKINRLEEQIETLKKTKSNNVTK